MKKSVNVEKIWQILGNIEGCQEELNRAVESKDFEKVKVVSQYLDKVKKRLDALVEGE